MFYDVPLRLKVKKHKKAKPIHVVENNVTSLPTLENWSLSLVNEKLLLGFYWVFRFSSQNPVTAHAVNYTYIIKCGVGVQGGPSVDVIKGLDHGSWIINQAREERVRLLSSGHVIERTRDIECCYKNWGISSLSWYLALFSLNSPGFIIVCL